MDIFKLEIMSLKHEETHTLGTPRKEIARLYNSIKNIKTINKRSMDLVDKKFTDLEKKLNKINEYKTYMEQLKILKERAKDYIIMLYKIDYALYNDALIKILDNLNVTNTNDLNSQECDFYAALEKEFKVVINNYDAINRIFSDMDYEEPSIYTKTSADFNKLPQDKNKDTITKIVNNYFDLSEEEREFPEDLTNVENFIEDKIAKIVEENNLTNDYKKIPENMIELPKELIFIKIDTERKQETKTNTEVWLRYHFMFGWDEIAIAKDNEEYQEDLNKLNSNI